MKVLCVLIPHFPLKCEIMRNGDLQNRQIILTRVAGAKKLVLDYTPELAGLQEGMPLQQAISRYEEVTLLQADIPYYRSTFSQILDLLEKKSPLVEEAEPGLAYLAADGLQLIYPDDNALAACIRETLPAALAARIGIAGGKFPAYLAALYSQPGSYRILKDRDTAFLAELPCDVLPVSLKIKKRLHDFGLHTLGRIASLPPGPLQSQFGPLGRKIWELALGYDNTPLYPRPAAETIEESTVLPSLITSLDALSLACEALLSRVFARLAQRKLGILSLTLWTMSWKTEYWEYRISFKEPAMHVHNILARIKSVLENQTQPGPVERLGLKITRVGYQYGQQKSLFPEVRDRDHLQESIKQLNCRSGSPQVFQIKEAEPWSRIPERRYILASLNH